MKLIKQLLESGASVDVRRKQFQDVKRRIQQKIDQQKKTISAAGEVLYKLEQEMKAHVESGPDFKKNQAAKDKRASKNYQPMYEPGRDREPTPSGGMGGRMGESLHDSNDVSPEERKLIPSGVKAFNAINKFIDRKFSDVNDNWPEEVFYNPKTKSFFVTYFLQGPDKQVDFEISPSGAVTQKTFDANKLIDLNKSTFISDVLGKL